MGSMSNLIGKVTCVACGSDDLWEGSEEVWRVTGEEGTAPERVVVAGCECGSQQVIG